MHTKWISIGILFLSAPAWHLAAQINPGTVRWTYDVGGQISSSPALAQDGTVYVGTSSGLKAVTNNGAAASNRWTFPIGIGINANGVGSSPAIGLDATIYFGGIDGNLYALNSDGSKKWACQVQGGGGSPAIALDGTIYFEGYSYLYAISPAGTTNWRSVVGDSGNFSSPAVGTDGTIYVNSWEWGTLSAFRPDGTKRWSVALPFSHSGGDSPSIGGDGTIYVTAGPLCAFTPNGTNIWYTSTNDFLGSSPIAAKDGTIFVKGHTDHVLYGVSPNGQVAWQALTDFDRYAPPTAPAIDAAGSLYYCASNSMWALSSQGQVRWVVTASVSPPPGIYFAITSPAIGADGTVYVALGGTLYAVASGTNGPANSPWPMYRQNPRHTGKVEKPSLQQPKKRADANFQFQIYGQIDQTQTVQTSTDLISWTALTNVVVTNVPMDVVDLTASNFTSRFYRTASQ